MTEKEKVGIALRNLRTNNTDLSVSEVATKMGKQKVWLSQIETWKRNIYFDDAKELCKIYGVKVSELGEEIDRLGGDDKWHL